MQGFYVRRIEGNAPLPDRLHRRLLQQSDASVETPTQLVDGWLIEPLWAG